MDIWVRDATPPASGDEDTEVEEINTPGADLVPWKDGPTSPIQALLTHFPIYGQARSWSQSLAMNWLYLHLSKQMTPKFFIGYWRSNVPDLYRLKQGQECLNPFRETREIITRLIKPLGIFVSGGHAIHDFEQFLRVTDTPATVCGRIFQVGEATYTCRECGMDPTCVLCVDCFKASAHKGHRYKIATSGGGGYCDCGDTEAWKNHVHCDNHKPSNSEQANEFPGAVGMEERAEVLFKAIIEYCFNVTATELTTHLPPDLKERQEGADGTDGDQPEIFCTVLYNDETHTFDLVIQTLTRALSCSKADAVEFATTIDREGRCIVKIAQFSPCEQVMKMIERQTSRNGGRPLKVIVVNGFVIAHQTFAMRLLTWLDGVCSQSSKLRKLVSRILLDSPGHKEIACISHVQGVLSSDTKLWKSARTCWHRLLISALLKDYDSKKQFAINFTRQYAEMMKDFIVDDHDHSFSITSLSVQIFTVPSIAHYLVEQHDVLYTIMRTLLSECETRLNQNQKLEFDRGTGSVNSMFKRTNFAILDMKYILTSPPSEWSEFMIKNFCRAIDAFLKLLTYMQEMDSTTRQVGQHMEYEPEWESAFNLHIKLQPVVQLSLEWCGCNRTVFIRAFRHCLNDLSKMYQDLKDHTVSLELANHAATCYIYDIGSQSVSVHLPLTRYFAGLYLFLEKFGLEFVSSEFNLISCDKPVPEMIIEPALRCQVLIAQVHAGMWKRNGYALLNQLYFYHNVRCRTDMLDKDIVTLQIGASLIESNEFMLHLISKFGLYQWALPNYDEKAFRPPGSDEDLGKYLIAVADELLGLIITIISARHVPGVGKVLRKDCIKKEVIQQLCIEPMTHSNLNKALVENVNYETGLELVIQEVANLKGPTSQRSSVVYELKPEYYDEYDVYHYHYTREEMSKSEERQRERKKVANEPEIFPPPRLPEFTPNFDMVINLLQCDVLLHVISLVLNRFLQKAVRATNESQLRKVFHLIGHGLREEEARNEREPEHFFRFCERAKRWGIFDLLDKLLKEGSVAQCHDMIMWIRKRHSVLKPADAYIDVEESQPGLPNPDDEVERLRKVEVIKQAKQKMMDKMAAAQKKFMAVNKDLFNEDAYGGFEEEITSTTDVEMASSKTVAVGPNRTAAHLPEERFICILCQENQPLAAGCKRFVLATFVQRSTVMCDYREKLKESCILGVENEYLIKRNTLVLNPDLLTAGVVSSCGHIMHESCWNGHCDTVFHKERRRPYRLRHPMSFDVDKAEWLCPMCDGICNSGLPMAMPLSKMYPADVLVETNSLGGPADPKPSPGDFDVWITGMQIVVKNKVAGRLFENTDFLFLGNAPIGADDGHNYWSCPLKTVVEEMESKHEGSGRSFEALYPSRLMDTNSLMHKWLATGFFGRLWSFMGLTYQAFTDTLADKPENFRVELYLYQSLAYTISSAETFHRDQKLAFFGEDVPSRKSLGLTYLTRVCGVAADRQRDWVPALKTFTIRMLAMLLQNRASDATLFECDAFGLLVALTFSMSSLFVDVEPEPGADPTSCEGFKACQPPSGSILDHHILRLVYMYHTAQILVSNDFSHCVLPEEKVKDIISTDEDPSSMDTSEPEEVGSKHATRKEHIFSEVWRICEKRGVPWDNIKRVDCEAVWSNICEASIPFLRCCAKLYENLTGVQPPKELEAVESSYEDLIKYLDLPPTFEQLFDSPIGWQLPYKWASHPSVGVVLNNKRVAMSDVGKIIFSTGGIGIPSQLAVTYPRRLQSLVDLPEDYTELINLVSNFTCINCNSLDSRTPTMCLVCGEILCSQSYCCQKELKQITVGACVNHSFYCGGGVGIFLRIRECKVFLIGGKNKGCFMPPPYLDEYGETDQGLRRGNPLTLCPEKYEVFRKFWLQHEIPEKIARVTEHSVSLVATEWQYL